MSDLHSLTICEVHRGLKDRKFSAEELTGHMLARIEKLDPEVKAFITVDKEGAMKKAAEVDASGYKGVLSGVPAAIKDLINTAGVRSTSASNILKRYVPPYDATCIAKLRDEDAVMLGKTNLDEFACGGSTEHSCFGATRNPWDFERIPGGSSGGSAAAVAARMAFYALGTDTGGSIRTPAALCGITGLKVTYGRVSRSGVTAMASSWDTIGPLGKTAEDCAYVLNAIAGKDVKDSTTLDMKVPDYTKDLDKNIKGLKIGVPKEYFAEGVDPEVARVVKDGIKELEKLGAVLKEVSLPMTKYAVSAYYISMPAELSANLARFDAIRYGSKPEEDAKDLKSYYLNARTEGFGDEIKRRIMIGTYVLSAGYYDSYYKKAQQVRTLIIKDFEKAFEDVDVLIAPVFPSEAFKIGEKISDPLAMYIADALTIPASAAGVPGLSVPCGFTKNKLPVGMQIIGPQFSEELILRVGHNFQKVTDWHTKEPL
ncbi:MAG: Asp-tRNA(Asn)/Glu-tRNA(Gln) amidotransferase subunit GatA [Patescibacteria group bacterium]